jgi:hypothetical protein
MADFIAVPAVDLENFLQSKKFERTKQRDEVVYIRRSTVDPCLMMKIYTSIKDGQTTVRAAGRDAIRVCVVWDNGQGRSFGVGKFPPVFRVHSVQSVLERLDLKLKEAAQRAKDWLGEQAKKKAPPPPPPPVEDPVMGSEPPAPITDPRDPAFAAYAASLEVPF